jgi:hypothetical protein
MIIYKVSTFDDLILNSDETRDVGAVGHREDRAVCHDNRGTARMRAAPISTNIGPPHDIEFLVRKDELSEKRRDAGDIIPKGPIRSFNGQNVLFEDGSEEPIDLVLYATGYDRDFSFLDSNLLEWRSGIPDLFLHSTPRNIDNLLFMGFINAAGGLGDGMKTQGLFVVSYARAFFGQTDGLQSFLRAKKILKIKRRKGV